MKAQAGVYTGVCKCGTLSHLFLLILVGNYNFGTICDVALTGKYVYL